MLNVGIVGSWLIDDESFIISKLDEWLDEEIKTTRREAIRIIRMNCKGFNQVVAVWIRNNKLNELVIYPLITKKRMSHRYASIELMAISDKIIAFDDNRSTATSFIIDYAKIRNKNLVVIRYSYGV